MPRAILDKGVIRPLDPLPPEWPDGLELRVEIADATEHCPEDIDRDFAQLAALCSQGSPEEDDKLANALQQARQQARRSMR